MVLTYFQRCGSVLLDPTGFFRREFNRISVSHALVIGLLSAWLSSFLLFIGSTFSSILFTRFLSDWVDDWVDYALEPFEVSRSFLFQSGALLLSPFFTLFYLLFITGVIYLFSKIFLHHQNNLTYKNCLKIVGVSMVSTWLALIPIFGEFIAYIVFSILVVVGIREVFWATTRRALIVVFAPQIMLLSFALMAFTAIAVIVLAWSNFLPLFFN